MLPLVELTQAEIDRIVARVPGERPTCKTFIRWLPLQEGILFHHLMGGEGDPYLLACQLSFDSRARLDGYLSAMQAVVDRHDILRTAVVWEGLPEPVQVVWRKAPLHIEEIELDPAAGDVAEQLYARFNPRQYRIDVRRRRCCGSIIAYDAEQERWLVMMLHHHLVSDHTTLEVMQAEVQAHLLGQADQLPRRCLSAIWWRRRGWGSAGRSTKPSSGSCWGTSTSRRLPLGCWTCRATAADIEEAHAAAGQRLSRRLRAQARQLGVSAASLCHLAWAQVLAQGLGARGCGLRHGAVRAHAGRRRRRPGDGAVHQHAAGADRGRDEGVEASVRAPHRCWPICCAMSTPRWRWRSGAARCLRRRRCSRRC